MFELCSKKIKKTMKDSWEKKAQEDPYRFIDSSKEKWDKKDYYNKGEKEAFNHVILFLKEKTLAQPILKKMKVLEIGCGTGRLSVALAKHFAFVDGIDISQKMIEIAQKDNKDIPNLKFYVNNGLDLSYFSNNTYDFIFSFLVFQHIPRKSIVFSYLKEIYRVLKPGGFMKIQVRGYPPHLPLGLASWRYRSFDSFFVALSEIRRIPFLRIPFLKVKKYDATYGTFFKKEELEKVVKKIGYSDVVAFYDKKNPKYFWVSGKK